MIKYQPGQQAILLSTDFKPIVDAVIKSYDDETMLYCVCYKYPKGKIVEEVIVPQERLMLTSEFVNIICTK